MLVKLKNGDVYYFGEALWIAVGIRHGAAVVSGQLVGVDLFQKGRLPFFLVRAENADLIQRVLMQEGLHQVEDDGEQFGCWHHIVRD